MSSPSTVSIALKALHLSERNAFNVELVNTMSPKMLPVDSAYQTVWNAPILRYASTATFTSCR